MNKWKFVMYVSVMIQLMTIVMRDDIVVTFPSIPSSVWVLYFVMVSLITTIVTAIASVNYALDIRNRKGKAK